MYKIFLNACLVLTLIPSSSLSGFAQESLAKKERGRLWTNWIGKNAKTIKSLELENFKDLQFLKKLIGAKRIVQLGEGGHGMREYSQAKTRLIKFLHTELNFEVIALESSFYQCYQSDLLAVRVNPMRSLIDCLFGVWHTREVLNLFEYIKASRQTKKPLNYIGFDIQPIGRNKKNRPAFFRKIVSRVDPEYGREVFDFDKFFLDEYAKNSRERRKSFRIHRNKFISGYEKLAGFLEKNLTKLTDGSADKSVLAATQTARFLAQYIRQQTASDMKSYAELRDQGMADNINFIVNKLYPNKKIIIWAHNAHVRYKNQDIPPTKEVFPGVATRMMGSWLEERYSGQIYTIGFYANVGTATNNRRNVYTIKEARDGTFEAAFRGVKGKYSFIDFSKEKRKRAWMLKPIEVRYNAVHPQELIVPDQYDGVFFIKNVSPPEYLY